MISAFLLMSLNVLAHQEPWHHVEQSAELLGFRAEPKGRVYFNNPIEAVQPEVRFEPEQRDPVTSIRWKKAAEGGLEADVVEVEPDYGHFAVVNTRYVLRTDAAGRWSVDGQWTRWKCRRTDKNWTTSECLKGQRK